jgi:acetyltransferase-like isoleucine patch superfamily enzyme
MNFKQINFPQRMFKVLGRVFKLGNGYRYRNHLLISDSRIENLDMVSSLATLRGSELKGQVKVGGNTRIIEAKLIGNIEIGRWTTINGPNSDIWALVNKVRIGNFCSIARNVSIQEYDHHFDRITSYFVHANVFGDKMDKDIVSKGDIIIGNDVWIGTQSVILSGATISDGVVIGANSVVNSFIPPYAIAVGSPAKVVKYRFSDQIIERLLKLRWWDWDDERIRSNHALFDSSLTEENLDQVK